MSNSSIQRVFVRNFNDSTEKGFDKLFPKTLKIMAPKKMDNGRFGWDAFVIHAPNIAQELGHPVVIVHQEGGDPDTASYSYYGPYFSDGRNAGLYLWEVIEKDYLPDGWESGLISFIAILKAPIDEWELREFRNDPSAMLDRIVDARKDWEEDVTRFRSQLLQLWESNAFGKIIQRTKGEFPELKDEDNVVFLNMFRTVPVVR